MPLRDPEKTPVKMDAVRELSSEELQVELAKLEEARFRLTFRAGVEDVKTVTGDNPLQFRTIRRNIARLKTALREREAL